MSANRPPAVREKAYVEVDLELLKETGEIRIISEPILAPEITERVPRGKFEVVYTGELFDVMKELGNRKIDVFAYLLDKKDGNNCVNTTIRKIAKETNTSVPTVQHTINILKDCGLLKREGTVYMMSPRLMLKGNQVREAYLMRKYIEIPDSQEDIKDDNIIDAELEGQLEFNMDGEILERAKVK